jgi:hypothetical protein
MQTPTANKISVFFLAFYFASQALADGLIPARKITEACGMNSVSAKQCYWLKGTISIYNGTPPIRIKPNGKRKTYAVGPAEQEQMPDKLKATLTLDNSITGKFLLCPLPVSKPRGFKMVCVKKAIMQKINVRH